MNWKVIKEKYPKSLDLFDKSSPASESFAGDIFSRILYDFFDDNGFMIGVYPRVSMMGMIWINSFVIIIHESESPNILFSETSYKNRRGAEEDAFTEAFKILEERL